jgi:hypothetical protein
MATRPGPLVTCPILVRGKWYNFAETLPIASTFPVRDYKGVPGAQINLPT